MKPFDRITRLGMLAGLLLCLGVSTGGAADAAYVGTDTCKECHEEMVTAYAKSFHGQAKGSDGKSLVDSCEACHGPGGTHAKDPSRASIVSFGKGSVQAAGQLSASCLGCHAQSQKLMYWDNSKHKADDVSCSNCHSIHGSVMPKVDQPEVCFGCHKDVKADVNKFSHHPIVEGKISCSDCHNPHGTLTKGMIVADSPNLLCYGCHADKRGPHINQHPPVEEDCLICHAPHGTKAYKLTREKMPNLCQNCHGGTHNNGGPGGGAGAAGFWTGANSFDGPGTKSGRVFGQSCINCHPNIHGSNAPTGTSGRHGQRFER